MDTYTQTIDGRDRWQCMFRSDGRHLAKERLATREQVEAIVDGGRIPALLWYKPANG